MGLRDQLTERILGLPGVEERRSRFRHAVAFFADRREFAHYHGDGEIDIRLTRGRIRVLKEELERDPRVRMRRSSDWLEFGFREPEDLERAQELIRAALEASR